MMDWHREQRRRHHHRHHPGAAGRGRRASAWWRSTPITASSGSKKSRSTATPCARASTRSMVSASMGIYVFNTDVLLRALHEDAQDPEFQPRFRQGRDPAPAWRPRARGRLRFPRHERQAGALLARCGHARRLLRSQHGPGGRGARVQPLRPALAHPHQGRRSSRRPSSSSRRKAGAWAWRWIPS